MKTMIRRAIAPLSAVAMAVVLLVACNCNTQQTADKGLVRTEVMTAEARSAMTPDDVIAGLKAGNAKFVGGEVTARDHSAMVRKSAEGQFPVGVVLSCLDSRIPVEDIFNRGIGDLFVARIAGNFANVDILGSMEFACKLSGAKVIVVMGHDHCGAIHGAIANAELGNLTATLSNLKPAVEMTPVEGEKSVENAAYVQKVAKNNVVYNIDYIRKNSPILKEMEDNGEIKIVGAFYDMETGQVEFM